MAFRFLDELPVERIEVMMLLAARQVECVSEVESLLIPFDGL
ncbi:MAG: hypothetical protein U9R74_08655 [Pseudomonadota bacterium]|nr:hypothetical protein [Pseudomonadota bacterium]